MEIKELEGKASRLAQLRDIIKNREGELKKELEPIKNERDALQEELLEDMHDEKVASLRVENGDMYTRAVRRGIQVTNEISARKWAKEHEAYSIDRRVVAQMLGKEEKLPKGFDYIETPYIKVTKNKHE